MKTVKKIDNFLYEADLETAMSSTTSYVEYDKRGHWNETISQGVVTMAQFFEFFCPRLFPDCVCVYVCLWERGGDYLIDALYFGGVCFSGGGACPFRIGIKILQGVLSGSSGNLQYSLHNLILVRVVYPRK